ncbi:putative Heat shock protein 70 family [Helianthus anomalus]
MYAKCLIGRIFSHAFVHNVTSSCDHFKVTLGLVGKPKIVVNYKGEDKTFVVEEISSMVFIKMKEIIEAFLGTIVKNAILIVHVYFNDL